MKKGTIITIALIAVAVFLVIWVVRTHNSMAKEEEKVNGQWANVESQYQRRADLIDNLVATVKGYATHESETLQNVTEARAKATQVTVDPENLTPERLQEYQAAQGELGSALGRLMLIVENYPDLKANQNFLELQSQIEGTENRIQVERSRYNDAVRDYNAMIRLMPRSIVASMFGFERKPFFEAESGAEKAPQVSFD